MRIVRWICIVICILTVAGGLLLQFGGPKPAEIPDAVLSSRPTAEETAFAPAEPETPALLKPFLTANCTVTALEPIKSTAGDIYRYSVSLPRGRARAWIFPGGAVFWCEESTRSFTLKLEGFPDSGCRLNEDDRRSPWLSHSKTKSVLIQPPLAREGRSLMGNNYVSIDKENGYVFWNDNTVSVEFRGDVADWWAYLAPSDLGQRQIPVWMIRCTVDKFGGQNRLTLDGYYYETPGDYIPTGKGWYYRLPAAYIASKLARWSDSSHGQQMAVAMLDLQREHYNEEGYIPTGPLSKWLNSDYGVGPRFYDTRFNTDVAHAYLDLGRSLGIKAYEDVAMNYASYLLSHAGKHAVQTVSGGILVDDYAFPGASATHCSLNHQLAEALFLFETEVPVAQTMAQRMVLGIEDTTAQWLRKDGNLHYARYPDGTFGGTDYPFLTYNDLLAMDRYLGGNNALRILMGSKREWMEKNGIREYDK